MNTDETLSSNCLIHRPYSNFVNCSKWDPTQEHGLHLVVMSKDLLQSGTVPQPFPALHSLAVLKRTDLSFSGIPSTWVFPHMQSQAMHFWQECHRNNAVPITVPHLGDTQGQPTPTTGDFNLAHLSIQFLLSYFSIFTKISSFFSTFDCI